MRKALKKKLLRMAAAILLMAAAGLYIASKEGDTGSPQDKTITLASYRDLTPGSNFFFPESSICRTWESLVGIKEDQFSPVPLLATSWTMSDGGKQWIFNLRQNVRFHDGRPFNADAVIDNFRRYENAPGKVKFYRFRMERYYPGFKRIDKIGDAAVRLTFHQPIPTLPYYMANWGSPMFSPACFDKNSGEFVDVPSGTGPFCLVEHVVDQYSVLKRFEGYWGEKAKSETIRLKVIPEVNTRYSAMKSEEISATLGLAGITPALAGELLKDERFAVSAAPSSLVHFLAVNGEEFPFNDVRMRRAVSMMIDRELLSHELYHDFFPPAYNLLSPVSPFHHPVTGSHDPQNALLLAKSVLGGRRAGLVLLLSTKSSDYPYKETAQYLQAVLKPIGLDITIHQVEHGAFNDRLLAGDYNLYLRCQGLPHGDPMGIFNDYMRLNGRYGMHSETQNKRYHYNYYNFEAESLLDKAQYVLDMETRREYYNRLQELAESTLPIIPLLHESTLIVHDKRLSGYHAAAYGASIHQAEWGPCHAHN